ncbi:MAG: arsenate reductase (glutaredoxin) [Kangiellaceae bacterium]|nr:arsenate reductase (glutaredoxin) [Kangiellaceae bacterium]
MSQFKILHNPRCSKSRQTLSLLEQNNVDFEIIEYLKNPPVADELARIATLLNLTPRAMMRKKESEYKLAGLDNDALSVEAQFELMSKNPKLIERPIVFSNKKAAIGRPPENILKLL